MKGFSKDFALRSNFEITIKTLSVLDYFSDFCLQFSKKNKQLSVLLFKLKTKKILFVVF